MSDVLCRTVIRKGSDLAPAPTKRTGVTERVYLSRQECPHQNVAVIEFAAGAEVEIHPSPTSESFYVLEGEIDMTFPDGERRLGVGDFCHLPNGVDHGVRPVGGSAKALVIFAPPSVKK